MTDYRRAFVPGATYFFTVNLSDRRATLLVDHIDLLRDAIRYVRRRHPFDIDAMVVLPDHLHAILTLPSGDADPPPALAPHQDLVFTPPAPRRTPTRESYRKR